MKRLDAVILALVLVAVAVGGLSLYVSGAQPSPSPVAAAPVAAAPASVAPEAKEQMRGPYQEWPLSFPKLLPGMFMLDDMAPQLKVTPQQARLLLPLVEEMGRNWRTVHVVEIKVKEQLSAAQRAWITEQKHQVEQGFRIDPVRDAAGPLEMGENASVKVALRICKQRMPSPLPPALQAAVDAERRRELEPSAFEQKMGEEWLTVFDESTALFYIDRDQPALRPTPEQAAKIHGILQDVVVPLQTVTLRETKLRDVLRMDQMKFIQAHMNELYRYRTGQFAFPNNPGTADKTYHDPLFLGSVEFLRKRALQENAGRHE